jgi:hypothetical protein
VPSNTPTKHAYATAAGLQLLDDMQRKVLLLGALITCHTPAGICTPHQGRAARPFVYWVRAATGMYSEDNTSSAWHTGNELRNCHSCKKIVEAETATVADA